MAVIYARNKALDVNPPGGASHLTRGGSDWLWAVCAVFTLSFVRDSSAPAEGTTNLDRCQLVYYLLSFKARNGEKIFHYLFTIGLFVGAVAYFAMASDLGLLRPYD
ncbi:hypothetical protein B0T10DRAFT_521775 [Thelonectria olida]|uniref:Uncharacterized protein n=1 Tax=Thelonectria olida TaxID=1576542 RepID=A0A9P8VVQ5_9HYPO|nr:hypothetical protein B0T10DRAFT_521775 [Thelonectria olida]